MFTCQNEASEQTRLVALRQLELLDTPPEPEFDEVVRIAAAICGAPISVVSMVDEHRQWFKAALGIGSTETPREIAFCNHTIRQAGMLLVEDATRDSRFAANPLVTCKDGLRFYAGVPVVSPEGQPVGTLCVMDRIPRILSADQCSALSVLAGQVSTRLELRVQRRRLQQALAEAEAARAHLAASEQRFQTFMNSGPFLSYMKDANGRFVYCNEPMARHFEVSRGFLLNKTDAELWPAEIAASYRQHDLAVLQSGQLCVVEEESRNPGGSTSMWRSYKFPCPDADGHVLLGGVSVEVTEELRQKAELKRYQQELEAANGRLQELASVDALTGVANRRVFDQQIKLQFRQARRKDEPLAVVLLDVDNFKRHNDRFGHGHGDSVLQMLTRCLQTHLRPDDLLARYGGEEFAIMLRETGASDALALAERLVSAIREFTWPREAVTVSMGVSSLGPATPDTTRLLTLADEALYAAKRAGKDRVVSYESVYARAVAAAREQHAAPSEIPEAE